MKIGQQIAKKLLTYYNQLSIIPLKAQYQNITPNDFSQNLTKKNLVYTTNTERVFYTNFISSVKRQFRQNNRQN